MNTVTTNIPNTPAEANALYKKAGKVLGTPKKAKKVGVVGISKAENAQLGLLLRYIFTNDEVYNSLTNDVLRYPDALRKLASRYSN